MIETVSQTVKSNSEPDGSNSNQRINGEKLNGLQIDWEGYREYLTSLSKSKKELQNKLGYGKTYCYILETENAQDLMKVSNGCRIHAMSALSTLSKYTGYYDEWMKIVKKYQLKWKNQNYNLLNNFKNIFGIESGSEQTVTQMIN